MKAIAVRDLTISSGQRTLVNSLHWMLSAGEILGLTGPSGGGKTLTASATLGLTDLDPGVTGGTLELHDGRAVKRLALHGTPHEVDARLAPLRGVAAVYLPQDADRCLDPLRTVGAQVRSAARGGEPEPWLRRAGFAEPEAVLGSHPHELSGGMARRVAIAMAIARGSAFLLADEPTTGLDPLTADHIARTLRALADDGIGVLWITHDLHRLCVLADRAIVLADGKLEEVMDTTALRTRSPSSPVGRALLDATSGPW
ncbi:MAG: ABC-type glutathione transport system ATPase component [Myxococcota bacterium]|jgi:ABC-type glutathione transport system ATPase component